MLSTILALSFAAGDGLGQTKRRAPKAKTKQQKPLNELERLREEFVKATNEYKASLEKLRASYEKDVTKAEAKLSTSKELIAQGLLSRNDVQTAEHGVAQAKGRVNETMQRMANADSQIAGILLEAEAEKTLTKTRVAKGALVRTASYVRFNGGGPWALSDAWKLQQFFLQSFKKTLPITVYGQGAIHNRWRLAHHNSIDVSLHPDSSEGQALLTFLRSNGIPFLAFRGAIPGTATGPHIHIGRPSHRY
jgi:F0F1-type ATP synthase membrane subunit b/b'